MAAVNRRLKTKRSESPLREYEFAVNRKTGGLYLRRAHSPFWGELPYVTVLVITVLYVIISCCSYIELRTSMEQHLRKISSLSSEYYRLEAENMQLEKETALMLDLDHVRRIADMELGMVPATEKHVLMYERRDSEYVFQSDNIPVIRNFPMF